jgi:hypothetical protein
VTRLTPPRPRVKQVWPLLERQVKTLLQPPERVRGPRPKHLERQLIRQLQTHVRLLPVLEQV